MSHPEIHPAVHSVGTGVGESLDDMVRRVQAMADKMMAERRVEKEAKAEKSARHVKAAKASHEARRTGTKGYRSGITSAKSKGVD
jgi:hypothetical protein